MMVKTRVMDDVGLCGNDFSLRARAMISLLHHCYPEAMDSLSTPAIQFKIDTVDIAASEERQNSSTAP